MSLDKQIEGALLRQIGIQAAVIQSALRKSVDIDRLVADWKASGLTTLTNAQARSWVKVHAVKTNRDGLKRALNDTHATGYALGQDAAKTRYARAVATNKAPSSSDTSGWLSTPWANWKPGHAPAALLVKPVGSLKKLLDDAGISIDGFDNTTYNRLGTVLGDTLAAGNTANQTADEIAAILNDSFQQVVDDPARALTIARTETARAMSSASMDMYNGFGVTQVEWLHSDLCTCKLCTDAEGLGPQDINFDWSQGEMDTPVTEPPMHPNCICAIAPVIDVADTALPAVDYVDSIEMSASIVKYSEDEARDERGRWTTGGGDAMPYKLTPLPAKKTYKDPKEEARDDIATWALASATEHNSPSALKDTVIQTENPGEIKLDDGLTVDQAMNNLATDALTQLQDLAQTSPLSLTMPATRLTALFKDERYKTAYEVTSLNKGLPRQAYLDARYEKETELGVPTNVPDSERPVYATLGGDGRLYGDATVTLKDDVKDRTTVTLGDSMDGYVGNNAWLLSNVAAGKITTQDFWDMASTRVSYWAHNQSVSTWWNYAGDRITGYAGLKDVRDFGVNKYVEAQIHGGVKLSDIASITVNPDYKISGAMQKTIDSLGITVNRQQSTWTKD